MEWRMSGWSRFWLPFSRAALLGFAAGFVTLYVATQLGFQDPFRWILAWSVVAIVTLLISIKRAQKLVTGITFSETQGLDLRVGWSNVLIPHEEISAVIAIAGTQVQGGTTLNWRGNWLISPQGRWRINSDTEGSNLLFQYCRKQAPFAWLIPLQGEPLPPSDVADQFHSNAPEKVLGRIRAQLVRTIASRIIGGLVIALITGLIIWAILSAKRGARGAIWALFLGMSAFSYLRSAGQVWGQYQMLTRIERQLIGL